MFSTFDISIYEVYDLTLLLHTILKYMLKELTVPVLKWKTIDILCNLKEIPSCLLLIVLKRSTNRIVTKVTHIENDCGFNVI